MQGIVRTLTSQGFEQKSGMIKLGFKRITLAVVQRINKIDTHGSKEVNLEAAAVIQQMDVYSLGQDGSLVSKAQITDPV